MWLKVRRLNCFGLMFRRRQKLPVLIKRVGSGTITTWFVFHSIDLAFLDVNGIVLEKVSFLKSWRTYKPKCAHSFVVEAQGGHLYNINRGDRIDLEIVP